MAITGLPYRAIDYGPVPERWDRVYSEFPEVRQELRKYTVQGGVCIEGGMSFRREEKGG